MYSETYKTLMKENKDDINRWKDVPYYWIGRINIVTVDILSKAIYRFSAIPTNYQWHFHRTRIKRFLKFLMKHKKTQIAKAILRKKKRGGWITLPTSDYPTNL